MPMFHKPLSLFAGVIHSDTGFYTCIMSSLYPATREQTIYGSGTRQLSKIACNPNSGNTDEVWKLWTNTISIRVNMVNV